VRRSDGGRHWRKYDDSLYRDQLPVLTNYRWHQVDSLSPVEWFGTVDFCSCVRGILVRCSGILRVVVMVDGIITLVFGGIWRYSFREARCNYGSTWLRWRLMYNMYHQINWLRATNWWIWAAVVINIVPARRRWPILVRG